MSVVETGTFLDMLNEASTIVRQDYPGAEFYESSLNIQMAGSGWRFVFNIPATGSGRTNTTVFLFNVMGQFQTPPQHIDQPWLEDVIIPLPIDLDLEQAVKLAAEQKFTGNIVNYTLRWALYPGVTEPSYILAIPSQNVRVWVGVYTQKVTSSPLTG